MSAVNESVLTRIDELLTSNQAGRVLPGDNTPANMIASCAGWLAAAGNLVELVISDPNSSYRAPVRHKQGQARDNPFHAHQYVADVAWALTQLKIDASAGMLSGLEARKAAETFDDMLDHADRQLADGKHEPAGILAGVVFEETIRRLCDKRGIEHRDKKLDAALNALKAKKGLSKPEEKEAAAAAELRGDAGQANAKAASAAHVKSVVEGTCTIIRKRLVA